MTEESIKDEQVDLSQESVFFSPLVPPRSFHSPNDPHFDLYPLSPIRFEESSLDQLWNDVPAAPPMKPMESLGKIEPMVSLRSKNGLKGLSWKIKDIVEQLGTASYKEVADELLSNLEIPQTASPMKDEKNIRRRVYDALNVLVAAGVIKKQGKKVLPLGASSNTNAFRTDKEDPLKEKRELLRSLARSYAAMKNLYERNSMQSKIGETIPYPLVVVSVPTHIEYDISLVKNQREVVAGVTIEGDFEVINSTEILKKVGLHQKQADIPKELKTLCGRL